MRESHYLKWQLWDVVNVETVDVETRGQWFEKMIADGLVDGVSDAKRFFYNEDDRLNSALFELHPQRFGTLHPIGQRVANLGGVPFTNTVMDSISRYQISIEEKAIESQRLKMTLSRNDRQQSKLMELAVFFQAFCAGGRQIFKFPSRIIELFQRTDVDGIPLEELQLPFDYFYMHFGRQSDFAVDGWAPDGVYVAQVGTGDHRVIQFAMTFAPDSTIIYENHKEFPEPSYVQALDISKLKIGVGEAVDLVYSEKIGELKRQMLEGIGADKLAVAQRSAPPGVQIVDATKKNAAVELDFIGGKHAEWHLLLRLIVNGLAYLSAYPEDRERRFGENAPATLVSIATGGAGNDARSAETKLQKLGYTAIHFCGTKSGSSKETADSNRSINDELTGFTWVRGHWRRQAHGPGHTLRTLKWVMPFKRGINRPAGDEHGHVYLVS